MSFPERANRLEFKTILEFKIAILFIIIILSCFTNIFIFSSTKKEKQITTQLMNINSVLQNISNNLKTNSDILQFNNYKIEYKRNCYGDVKDKCFNALIKAKTICDFDDECKGFNSEGCLCFSNKFITKKKGIHSYIKK